MDKDFDEEDLDDILFVEFFAGDGVLSAAVSALGIPCDDPQDVATGGADFGDLHEVEKIKQRLYGYYVAGYKLVVHFAPPCSTFSRARDRSWKTRLRSSSRPQGLLGKGWLCKKANLIAGHTLYLPEWLVRDLQATVSFENPESSYMWTFLEFDNTLEFNDVIFSPCLFGADVAKPTRLRCWGWRPSRLDNKCTLKGDTFTCGRTRANPHRVLQFGGGSTAEAATYAAGVCEAWAAEVHELVKDLHTPTRAVKRARLTGDGRVQRHQWRGEDACSKKELREVEDQQSTAGMRNPSNLDVDWPELREGVADLRTVLLELIDNHECFQGLAACCGGNPTNFLDVGGGASKEIVEKAFSIILQDSNV